MNPNNIEYGCMNGKKYISQNMLRLNVSYSIENIKYNNAPPARHKSFSNIRRFSFSYLRLFFSSVQCYVRIQRNRTIATFTLMQSQKQTVLARYLYIDIYCISIYVCIQNPNQCLLWV